MLGTQPDPVTRFRSRHPEEKVEYLIIFSRLRGDRDRRCYPQGTKITKLELIVFRPGQLGQALDRIITYVRVRAGHQN